MIVYKKSSWMIARDIIIGIVGLFFAFYFLNVFIKNLYIAIILPAILAVVYLVNVLFAGHRIEIEGTTLRYFAKRKLKHSLELKDAHVRYEMGKSSINDAIFLFLTPDGGEECRLDCEYLGKNDFYILLTAVKKLSGLYPSPEIQEQPEASLPAGKI